MFADIGNFSLYISFLITQVIIINGLFSSKNKEKIEKYLWMTLALCITSSFISLISCYVISDYSVLNVVYNSSEFKPLLYKIAGSWSNHEGSMLLWLLCLVGHTVFFAIFTPNNQVKSGALVVQALLTAAFLLFVILSSNPFLRIFPQPTQGLGMNPLLQDIAVSFHPPILYLGYLGFSLPFSITIAALIYGKFNQWQKIIKTPLLFSWFFLTVGIATGAWWAYRELGWGGFWFWDPVENASLLPWLTATILIHSIKTANNSRNSLYWCLLLSIITFTFVMIGTFIVRSGIINSVHAFAHDPKRGGIILFIIAISSGLSLLLLSTRFNNLLSSFKMPNKNGKKQLYIMLNNILFTIITSIVLLGTIYPLISQILYNRSTVIAPEFYNSTVVPIILMTSLLCSNHIRPTYKKNTLRNTNYFLLLILISLIIYNLIYPYKAHIYISIALYSLVQFIALFFITNNTKKLPSSLLPHIGFISLTFFASIHFALKKELTTSLSIGEKAIFSGQNLTLHDIQYSRGANYIAKTAIITTGGDKTLEPQIRNYPIERTQTSETAILQHLLYDLYISIGSTEKSNTIVLDIKFNPAMNMIWLSCSIIALGALLTTLRSLFAR